MKVEKASLTAFTVAQGTLLAASRPRTKSAVSEAVVDAIKQIMNNTEEGKKRLKQLESGLFRWYAGKIEKLIMPGFYLHYILRKRYIEDITRQAISDGYTQVISLGAGFDTLALRLHKEFPNVHLIEIDHPATSRVKQQAIDTSAENLDLLAVDLAEHDLVKVLSEHSGFDGNRQTIFICEGVMPYLPTVAVTELFSKIKQLSGSGTRFVFTAVAPAGSPNSNTGKTLEIILKFMSEPLLWRYEMADMSAFIPQQNYKLIDRVDDLDLAPRYVENPEGLDLHRGEFVVFTEAL